MQRYERLAYQEGAEYVAGVDEAGRGCLAGPVVAAAVILPEMTVLCRAQRYAESLDLWRRTATRCAASSFSMPVNGVRGAVQ